MNRTIKDATVKRYFYDTHHQPKAHLIDFLRAYNFARRLKTLRGLTPYEYLRKLWTQTPDKFTFNTIYQNAGTKQLVEELTFYMLGSCPRTLQVSSMSRQVQSTGSLDASFPHN